MVRDTLEEHRPPVHPDEARRALLDLIARLSDAEAVALWQLIVSWYPRPRQDDRS